MLVTPHSPHAPYEGTYQQAECNQRYKPSTAAAHLSLMWMDYKKRKPLSLALLVKLFLEACHHSLFAAGQQR